MYINVGIGNKENKKQYNIAYWDWDVHKLYYWDDNNHAITSIHGETNNNYGIRKYPIYDKDGEVQEGAITIYSNTSRTAPTAGDLEMLQSLNKVTINNMSLGVFDNEQDCVVSKKIQYTNRLSGQGWSSSESNVEYTEVTPTETAPEKWEEERLYAYYIGREMGVSDNQKMYVHTQIIPSHYDWETLYTYLQNNPTFKLYKNTELSQRVIIGTDENCVSFNITKGDLSHGSSTYYRPYASCFSRNANTTYEKDSGGYIIPGTDPTNVPFSLWDVQSNPWSSEGWNRGIAGLTTSTSAFYTDGRLKVDAPETKSNPITECTLMQIGQLKFEGHVYTGVFRVTYKSAFYWGYHGTGGVNPQNWSQLNESKPVSYDETMNTWDNIESLSFTGIRLDLIEVDPDVKSGDIPTPPKPTPGSGDYNYPSTSLGTWGSSSFGMLADPNRPGLHIYCMTSSEFGTFIGEISSWQSLAKLATKNLSNWWSDVLTGLTDPLLGIASAFSNVDATYNAAINASVDLSSTIVFCRKMPNFVSNKRITNPGYPIKIGSGIIKGLTPDYFKMERIVNDPNEEFIFSAEKDSLGFQTATFYDLEPYVQAKLYLPYYGDIDLPISSFIDGSIKVQYGADILSGNGLILVTTNDRDGKECRFGPYQCNISTDVPLAVTDANASGRQMALGKIAVATSLAAATGGTSVAMMGGLSAIDNLTQKRVTQTLSTVGSNTALLVPEDIILQLTYPATLTDKDDKHNLDSTIETIGTKSYQKGKVNEFLNESKITRYEYVNTSTIHATQAEKNEIERLLREGVY